MSLAGHPIFSPASPEPVLPRGEPQLRPRSRTLRSLSARLTRLRPSAGWPILFEVRRRGRPPAAPPPHRRPRAPVPPADPGQQPIYTPLPTLPSTTFHPSSPPPTLPSLTLVPLSCIPPPHTPPNLPHGRVRVIVCFGSFFGSYINYYSLIILYSCPWWGSRGRPVPAPGSHHISTHGLIGQRAPDASMRPPAQSGGPVVL